MFWFFVGAVFCANCPDGTLVDFPDNNNHFLPSREYQGCKGVTKAIIQEGIKKIGIYTFDGCSNLTEVSLPSTLEELQEGVFRLCTSLSEIDIPDSVYLIDRYAFQETALQSIILPLNINSFGAHTFRACTSLVSIYLSPENAKYDCYNNISIYGKGFYELIYMATGITTQDFHPNTITIGDLALSHCNDFGLELVLPDNVTTLKGQIVYGCWYLENISMGNKVTSIRDDAFVRASRLQRINMRGASSVYQTYDGMLYSAGLTKMILCPEGRTDSVVTIPKNMTSFAYSAFGGTTGYTKKFVLEEGSPLNLQLDGIAVYNSDNTVLIRIAQATSGVLTIPTGTKTLGIGCCYICRALTEVNVPNTVTDLEGYIFGSVANLVVNLPSSVLRIGVHTFGGSGIQYVKIPERVTEITSSCFRGCQIRTVTLPENLEYIRSYAFSKTQYLQELTFPKYLKTLEAYAFDDSTVTNVVLPDVCLSQIEEGCFCNCLGLTGIMTIPSCVSYLGKKSFGQCTNIEKTIISNCGTYVEEEAFFAVPNMQITCIATNFFTAMNQGVQSRNVFFLMGTVFVELL